MDFDKTQKLNNSFDMYIKLLQRIKEIYAKSEDYLIPTRPELNDILHEAEAYLKEVFNSISHASGGVTEVEQAFMAKLDVYKESIAEPDANSFIESTFDNVPKYIELANEVDKKTGDTTYAKELVNDTLALCKMLMDIDGNTYADESSFTYSFIDMLEKYIKDE